MDRYKSKGMLTGSIMGVFDNKEISYLESAFYYDNKGRLIQTQSTNYMDGTDSEYIAYNFSGLPVEKTTVHKAKDQAEQTEIYWYSYDHALRPTETWHQLKSEAVAYPKTLIAENTYDELGRLKTNRKGENDDLETKFAYNIRSWTTQISSPLFTQNLWYNTNTDFEGGEITPQYGGNIAAMSWKLKDDQLRNYNFTYDKQSQLHKAEYKDATNNNYSTSYLYDLQGNINTLTRNIHQNNQFTQVVTTNRYHGNQIYEKRIGRQRPPKEPIEYNKNGALKTDPYKGITSIQYNSLNLPLQVDIKNQFVEARNEYAYTASGQKLKMKSRWNQDLSRMSIMTTGDNNSTFSESKVTDYAGNKIYENGKLKRILIDGGYIAFLEGTNKPEYHYYLSDHLGNNRVVAKASGEVIQKTHFYPFGMSFADSEEPNEQPYLYNGKEYDGMHGLNLYDYSARFYDPEGVRFTSIDPHAENYYSWSPYAYVGNNPMRLTDPTGMDWYEYTDEDGNTRTIWRKSQDETYEDGDGNICFLLNKRQ